MRPNWYRGWVNAGIALAVFVGCFAFYVFTGPPDIAWGEGAGYQRRVALAEIGEGPWDRPLYVLVSQPFLMIPRDSLPRRTNVASAAFAAAACLYVYLLLKFLLQIAPQFIARRVGIVGAIVLVVSHTFWLRAVTPGPEALDGLLLAALLYYLLRFANEGRVPFFYLAMGILGLSLSNNLMMVFLLPVFAIWVRVVRPPLVREIGKVRARGLGVLLLSSGVALAVSASHWARTGFEIPPEQWAWVTFWRDNMMLSWDEPLKASAIRFGMTLLYSFPPWTFFIGLLGMLELFRRQKYVFGLLFPLFVVYSVLAITLKLPDPMSAYVPAWVVVSIAAGYGWWKLLADGGWRDYAFALVLSLSPVLLYRAAPWALDRLEQKPRAGSFLDLEFEVPFDPLTHLLNPDRRESPDARAFAQAALRELPERARVAAVSRHGELFLDPLRYMSEVEQAGPEVMYERATPRDESRLQEWAASTDVPLFLVGLHPPNPIVESLLETYHFVPTGPFFRVLPKESVPGRVLIDAEEAGDVDEPISLVGDWHGYVLPQGYPVSFSITEQSVGAVGAVGADESLGGNVVLNEGGAQSVEGLFTRVSPIGESLVARVTYDEEINIHLDAELVGNRLEGTWLVYEAQYLNGRFRAWRQTPPAPPPGPPDA